MILREPLLWLVFPSSNWQFAKVNIYGFMVSSNETGLLVLGRATSNSGYQKLCNSMWAGIIDSRSLGKREKTSGALSFSQQRVMLEHWLHKRGKRENLRGALSNQGPSGKSLTEVNSHL